MSPDTLLELLARVTTTLVRRDSPDLTARQQAVFLTVYLEPGPHTVRGLAEALNVSKPAITRALDRLEEFEYLRRERDVADRRSVNVRRTVKGAGYLREVRRVIAAADAGMRLAA